MDTKTGQQTKSTIPSSTSSLTTGRETLELQRGHGIPNHFLSTNAYTQHGVTETFGPEPHRPSANNPFVYSTTLDHHTPQGEGSQTTRASSTQHESRTPRMEEAVGCPYHGSILQYRPTNAPSGQGLSPMDRYVAEGPSERYAILPRPDGDKASTHNGCRCREYMQSSADAKGRSQKWRIHGAPFGVAVPSFRGHRHCEDLSVAGRWIGNWSRRNSIWFL